MFKTLLLLLQKAEEEKPFPNPRVLGQVKTFYDYAKRAKMLTSDSNRLLARILAERKDQGDCAFFFFKETETG